MGDSKFRQTGRRTAKGPYRADELERRKAEGAERNSIWVAMPDAEKVRSLQARRGDSKRQLSKLLAPK